MHYSVGAIIKNKNGQYLLIDRMKEPLGFAGLAGHIDEGESPLESLIREIKEESGLSVIGTPKLLLEEELNWNSCSKGINSHYWYLYECDVEGQVVENTRETKSIGWYNKNQISELNLEPVWNYWYNKINL